MLHCHVCPQGGTSVILQNVPDRSCRSRPLRNSGRALPGVEKVAGCPSLSALVADKCHPCWAKQKRSIKKQEMRRFVIGLIQTFSFKSIKVYISLCTQIIHWDIG